MKESKALTYKRLSSVKSNNTKPEMIVRRFLHRNGFRYRINQNKLPGRPDLVLPKYNVVIFIHGCYWHRHEGCKYASVPKKNIIFWNEKFNRNVNRDKKVQEELKLLGWIVFVMWECELNDESLESLSKQLINFLD